MDTPNAIKDRENERIEEFLRLLKTNPEAIEYQILKNEYMKLLMSFFEMNELSSPDALHVLDLLNLGLKLRILNKDEVENKSRKLLNIAFEKMVDDNGYCQHIIPRLIESRILHKDEIKNKCKKFLSEHVDLCNHNSHLFAHIMNYDIWNKEDLKKYKGTCKNLLNSTYYKSGGGANMICNLLKLNIRKKGEIEKIAKDLLITAISKGSYEYNWWFIVFNVLDLNVLNNEKYKFLTNDIFDKSIKNAEEYEFYMAEYIIPKLLKTKMFDKKDIEDKYKELLNILFDKFKNEEENEAAFAYLKLLNIDILEKHEIEERYKNLLNLVFEESDKVKNESIFIELLKMDILSPKDKKLKYKKWLMLPTVKNSTSFYVPELLKSLDLCEKDVNIELPQTIGYLPFIFLEKNKDKTVVEDMNFIDQIDNIFSKEEINYLYKQDYEYFKEIEIAVKEKDYQKIWEVKKEFYSREEKEKVKELEKHFGKGIWVYFVDKVPGNKKLKNRFRDPHNALLRDIITFYFFKFEKIGITKEDFLKNYLGVAGDRNNGYQQLNDFIVKYKSNWKELVEGAINTNGFKENKEFVKLAEGVLEQERTGALYKNLDTFEQVLTLLHMIGKKEALIKLQKLADSEDPNDKMLYEYYKSAIYHPRTKPIIMKMYEDPEDFLGLDDTTFRELNKIHQAKKPSNMVENFEFLDFDAKDLVNCLPLGIYDQLSYFKPFEMKFYISGSDVFTKEEIQEKVIEFLKSVDQKKITNIIKKLKEHGDETMWYQIWKENKGKFIDELTTKYTLTDLIDMFVGLGYSEFNKYKDLRLMTAKISPKSDPNNRFNGFNCDSLAEGHGKKVVAMFNPYCTDFCIYEGDQDPKEDNLKVTSWVTLNRAIPENFTTLLNKVKSETTHDIANVLGDKFEDYRDPSEYVITMDNIEANPNFGRKNEEAVRKMYEKFFSEYVRQNPMSPNGIPINTHKFYSGVNYNKLNILTDKVPNESLPVFVNAYSDNSKSYSLQGNLDAGEQKEKEKKIGIHPLSIEDVVQISYMEGKIYPSSMKDHLGNLQHEITASILNNTLKGRPNLSFARYNEEGKIGGYILAYQGKMEDGTPGVYISDFAMDEKERGTAGIKMIHHWMKEVKDKYPNMPVFTRARENTSYRMIKAFAEKQGYEIVKDEIMEDGGENFHWVIMNPKK